MHQSIPAAPSSPLRPPAGPDPWLISIFCLGWQILGSGDSCAVKYPEVGTKKRANAPSSINTATFFIDRTIESCYFTHFNVQYFVLQ